MKKNEKNLKQEGKVKEPKAEKAAVKEEKVEAKAAKTGAAQEAKKPVAKKDEKKKKVIVWVIIAAVVVLVLLAVGLCFVLKGKSGEEHNADNDVVETTEEGTVKQEEQAEDSDSEKDSDNDGDGEGEDVDKGSTGSNTGAGASGASSNKNNGGTSGATASSQFVKDVNSVRLNPVLTHRTYVDNEIGKIVSSITNGGMSNYEKLVAAYNYVIRTMQYNTAHNVLDLNVMGNRYSGYRYHYWDKVSLYWAENALLYKDGVCDTYAGLLQVLTRRIGFDTYTVEGYSAQGSGHTWNVIKAGGNQYILDAQGDDNGATSRNYYFGVNMNDYRTRYLRVSYTYPFYAFQEYKQLYVIGTMGGQTVRSNEEFITDGVSGRVFVKTGESRTLSVKSDGGEGEIRSSLLIKKPDGTFDIRYENTTGGSSSVKFSPYTITYTFPQNGLYEFQARLTDQNTSVILEFYVYVTSTGDKYFE